MDSRMDRAVVNFVGRARAIRPEQWLEAAYGLVALALGALQAWPARFQPSTIDAVSYLDLGDAYLHGRWHDTVNLYWNPLYSWILGVALAVVRPSAWFEYPLAKLVDFGIYAVCLVAFSWFLRSVRAAYRTALDREGDRRASIPDWIWIVGGYTLFIWSSLRWITLTSSTPDMCATALAYGVWGLALRREEHERRFHYPLLGALLALSYFSRTPMLIVGGALVLFIGLDHATPRRRRGAIVAGAVLLMLTAPYFLGLSYARGHLTIGDNGALNHAWLANPGSYQIPNRHWQGGPPGYGAPLHPSRLLWTRPPTFEFATPIGGTYPPWTDPSYWYAGLTYHFDGNAEWISLKHSLQFEYQLIGGGWFLLALIALAAAGRPRDTLAAVRRNVPYWVPALIGLTLYLFANDLLVQWTDTPQPPSRYVSMFNVLAGLVLAASFRARPIRSLAPVMPVLATWVVIGSVVVVGGLARDQAKAIGAAHDMPPWQVARRLEDVGVAPGARVAIIGSPAAHEFWARLARVRIIADIADDRSFWAEPAETQALVLQILARTGAEAVVSQSAPFSAVGRGWRFAAGTRYGVRALADARGAGDLVEKTR